ncbi:MAG: hypothetical protein AB8B74_07050 [Crocinitomicaceae bacterium]
MLKLLILFLPIFIVGITCQSCVKGCIDDNAINYDPSATANRGCVYPETANIIAVRLSSHSTNDLSGNAWDNDGTAPDKFFKIINNATNEAIYVTNVEEFLPTSWTIEPSVSVLAEDVDLRFELYDQDDTQDVLMDKVVLVLNDRTGSSATTNNDFYPEEITLYGENNATIILTLEWTD